MAKTYNKRISDNQLRIGPVRFVFSNVFEPTVVNEGEEPKYNTAILIDPKTNQEGIDMITDMCEEVAQRSKDKWGGKIPSTLRRPLRDGDDKADENESYSCYAGKMFLNCSSKFKPQVVGNDGGIIVPLSDSTEFYPGCYGAIVLNFFPYSNTGNKGIGVGMGNILKTDDGERLGGGGHSADEDFDDLL